MLWVVLLVGPGVLGFILASYAGKSIRETMVLRLRRDIARNRLYLENGVVPPISAIDKQAEAEVSVTSSNPDGAIAVKTADDAGVTIGQ